MPKTKKPTEPDMAHVHFVITSKLQTALRWYADYRGVGVGEVLRQFLVERLHAEGFWPKPELPTGSDAK